MNLVVNWRIAHHKATRDGKVVDAKTVIFEEIWDGVHMSTRQIDHELWDDFRARNLEGWTLVQKPDLHCDPNKKIAHPGSGTKKRGKT